MMINRYDMRIKTNYKKCIRTVCNASVDRYDKERI